MDTCSWIRKPESRIHYCVSCLHSCVSTSGSRNVSAEKVFLQLCLPKETRRAGKWPLLHLHSQILGKSSFISIASFMSRTPLAFRFPTSPTRRRLEGQFGRATYSTPTLWFGFRGIFIQLFLHYECRV